MGSSQRRLGLLGILTTAGWLLTGPAVAEWLVTTDGSAVETRGAWEARGRVVVFHTADGTLSSMRLTDVDLAASQARTEAAAKAASEAGRERPAPAQPRPKARFVLTDADVGHVEEEPLAKPRDSPVEDAANPIPEKTAQREVGPEDNPLEVSTWDAALGAGASGVAVTGVVRNPSEFFASGISVEVRLFSLEGAEIASKPATLVQSALAPGEQSRFKVAFPDVFSVANALFDITSFNAVVSKPAEES